MIADRIVHTQGVGAVGLQIGDRLGGRIDLFEFFRTLIEGELILYGILGREQQGEGVACLCGGESGGGKGQCRGCGKAVACQQTGDLEAPVEGIVGCRNFHTVFGQVL